LQVAGRRLDGKPDTLTSGGNAMKPGNAGAETSGARSRRLTTAWMGKPDTLTSGGNAMKQATPARKPRARWSRRPTAAWTGKPDTFICRYTGRNENFVLVASDSRCDFEAHRP
jgi:hypothetical protein